MQTSKQETPAKRASRYSDLWVYHFHNPMTARLGGRGDVFATLAVAKVSDTELGLGFSFKSDADGSARAEGIKHAAPRARYAAWKPKVGEAGGHTLIVPASISDEALTDNVFHSLLQQAKTMFKVNPTLLAGMGALVASTEARAAFTRSLPSLRRKQAAGFKDPQSS